MEAERITCPSGGAFAAKSVPICPPAPGRFSGTTTWPRRSVRRIPASRPTTSVACPGGQGMIMRICRLGQGACAAAGLVAPRRMAGVARGENAVSASSLRRSNMKFSLALGSQCPF